MKHRWIAALLAGSLALSLPGGAAFAQEEALVREANPNGSMEESEAADAGLDERIQAYLAERAEEQTDDFKKASDGNLVVVIDAGHGGKDGGSAARSSVKESTLNLKIAQACRDTLLEYRDVTVIMTREDDTYLTLDERVQVAIDNDADLMISIHNNEGGARGAEILVSNGNYNPTPHAQTIKVANSIMNSLCTRIGVKNRGLITREGSIPYPDGSASDYYHIVRGCVLAGIPGMIIEQAYLDSSDYSNYLSSDAKLQAMGAADALGIAEAYGLKLRSSAQTTAEKGDAPFTDVYDDNWYYDAAVFAYQNGLMSGTSATTFEPKITTTRAMAIQILYNYQNSLGEVNLDGAKTFDDVPENAWYADALRWASANGVVNGVSETKFDPDGEVTRQQFVSMLYRWTGGQAENDTALDSFSDASSVANWAQDAMCWAVENGVLNGAKGSDGTVTLNPNGTATRAEIAQLMKNFIEV